MCVLDYLFSLIWYSSPEHSVCSSYMGLSSVIHIDRSSSWPYGLCTSSFCVECPHFVWFLPTCLQFNCHPLREISLTFRSQIYSYSTRSLSLPTLIIILLFNKSLQSAQYVSGTILGTWDITVNKTKSLSSWSFYSDKRKKAINKHITV